MKWLKAANRWIQRCYKVLVCRLVLQFSNLQVSVQHKGRHSALHQSSTDCQAETNSSFQMQLITDRRSNHHVYWFGPCNLQIFSLNGLLLHFFFWKSNLEFQHCVLIIPKNHQKHTSLMIFEVLQAIFASLGATFEF